MKLSTLTEEVRHLITRTNPLDEARPKLKPMPTDIRRPRWIQMTDFKGKLLPIMLADSKELAVAKRQAGFLLANETGVVRVDVYEADPTKTKDAPVVYSKSRVVKEDQDSPLQLSPKDKAFAALPHSPKVQEQLFAHRAEAFGTQRGVRLDIPSVAAGRIVYTIHEGPRGGPVIGYDHSAVVKNATFYVSASGQNAIGAGGGSKFPMAYVGGTLVDEEAKPTGVPVYYDPRVVHLWVDARNMRPLKGAAKVNLLPHSCDGCALPHIRTIYTFAEGPEYFRPGETPLPPEGMDSAVAMPSNAPWTPLSPLRQGRPSPLKKF